MWMMVASACSPLLRTHIPAHTSLTGTSHLCTPSCLLQGLSPAQLWGPDHRLFCSWSLGLCLKATPAPRGKIQPSYITKRKSRTNPPVCLVG